MVLIPRARCSYEAAWQGSGLSTPDHGPVDRQRGARARRGSRAAGQCTRGCGDSGTAASALSDEEKALLQKINALKAPRWCPFGACSYDWAALKVMAGGVCTTTVQCGGATTAGNPTEPAATTSTASVAVHCDTLKLSIRSGDQAWSAWRLPYSVAESKERGGEDLMVVALCANAKPIPTTQPATPPEVPPATKPATKPAANPAQKAPTTKP